MTKADNREIKTRTALIIFFVMTISMFVMFFIRPVLFDDGYFHLGRLKMLSDDLSLTNIKPWIYKDTFYKTGYPLGVFYPDLFLYPFALIVKLGVDVFATYLFMMICISYVSTVSFYFCAKKMLSYFQNEKNQNLAFYMSIMYYLYPYRLYDMHFRMAIGESMVFIFLPIAMLGVYELLFQRKFNLKLFIAMSGIAYSHILSTVIMIFVLTVVYLILIKKILEYPKVILYTIINAIMTVLCSLCIILPILEMHSFTKLYYQTGTKTFGELKNCAIGIAADNTVALILSTVLLLGTVFVIVKCSFYKKLAAIMAYNIFMCTGFFCWGVLEENMPALNTLQFPTRLLLVSAIPFAVLAGRFLKERYVALFVFFGLFLYLVTIRTAYYVDDFDISIIESNVSAGRGEYLPCELRDYYWRDYKIPNVTDEYRITREGNDFEFVSKNDEVELPLGYYKGYAIKGEHASYGYEKSENGLIKVTGLKDNKLTVYYEGTLIQKVSLAISGIAFLIICCFILIRAKYKAMLKK